MGYSSKSFGNSSWFGSSYDRGGKGDRSGKDSRNDKDDRNGGYDRDGKNDRDDHDGKGWGWDWDRQDRDGKDRDGKDRDGKDRDGKDWDGKDWDGKDWDGKDHDGKDWDGKDWGWDWDGKDHDGKDWDGKDHDGKDCDGKDKPEPKPDEACVCSDDMVAIDVLDNDGGGSLTIVAINGEAFGADNSVTLASGAIVTLLADGTLKYDLSGDDSFDDLLIGQTAADQFQYTVSNGDGDTATTTVDIEVDGALNTLDTIAASLPSVITFQVHDVAVDPNPNFGVIDFDMTISGSDPRLDGLIDDVYCVVPGTEYVPDTVITGNLYLASAASVPAGLVGLPDNLDNLSWLMNQQFENQDNGDGTGENYTTGEIQAAIWRLMSGTEFFVPGGGSPPQTEARANAAEIYNAALASGDGFVPGDGDIVSLIVDPTDAAEAETGFEQPFVIGVPWDDLKQECECECNYLV
jgi:hypothetical protein